MILAKEIEQRRTADQLKLFVEEVRDRVEADKSELRIARKGSGLYRMFIDEVIPLSQFAHLIYPSDTFFQPVIGSQGFDVKVYDGAETLIDRVEIAKPHDGYAEACDDRLVEEHGLGKVRVCDLGGQLDELAPCVTKKANDKSMKDYSDCTLVFVVATLPPFEEEQRNIEIRALELVEKLNGMMFKAKRAFLAVPALDKCYAIEV